MGIAWSRNDFDHCSGVSAATNMAYVLRRDDSRQPRWWVSEVTASQSLRILAGLENLGLAKAFCLRRDVMHAAGATT